MQPELFDHLMFAIIFAFFALITIFNYIVDRLRDQLKNCKEDYKALCSEYDHHVYQSGIMIEMRDNRVSLQSDTIRRLQREVFIAQHELQMINNEKNAHT
jgi:hypothetical protein